MDLAAAPNPHLNPGLDFTVRTACAPRARASSHRKWLTDTAPPHQVAFFDDLQRNVGAAAALGVVAVQVGSEGLTVAHLREAVARGASQDRSRSFLRSWLRAPDPAPREGPEPEAAHSDASPKVACARASHPREVSLRDRSAAGGGSPLAEAE